VEAGKKEGRGQADTKCIVHSGRQDSDKKSVRVGNMNAGMHAWQHEDIQDDDGEESMEDGDRPEGLRHARRMEAGRMDEGRLEGWRQAGRMEAGRKDGGRPEGWRQAGIMEAGRNNGGRPEG
jgi:hypothetical protein